MKSETTYTIHETEHSYTTDDAEVAELYSRCGLVVTAATEGSR